MKKLEELKQDILDNKLSKFYVFYGEDYGIRKHYINKLGTFFSSKINYTDTYKGVKAVGKARSLFGSNERLVVIYNDVEFAELDTNLIQKFINELAEFTCIFVYEDALENTNLFKHFDEYITNFPVVQSNIAEEFVFSELKISNESASTLADNCENNYNNILLESDKIRTYATAQNVSEQTAYESLDIKNQLMEHIDDFSVNDFMNDWLSGSKQNFPYWYDVLKDNPEKLFMSLIPIFNDLLIAALLVIHGRWKGGQMAYDGKLPWGRTKVIRELPIAFEGDTLYEIAYKVACVDGDIKSGRLERDKIVDFFFSRIIY